MRNKSNSPENWTDEIRPRILNRDGYKCKRCNIKHRSYLFIDQNGKRIIVDSAEHEELKTGGYKTYRVYLQVAHMDNNPSNNNDSNLLSLCPNCHYINDKQYKAIIRIAKLAAGLPKPPHATAQANAQPAKIR